MKKCLSVLLCLTIILSFCALPIEANAAEVLYSSSGNMFNKDDIDKYDIIDVDPALVDEVRENLASHKGMFSVDLMLDSIDQANEQYCLSYAHSLFMKATEHDGNPVGGDYILYQTNNLNYNCTAVLEEIGITLKIRYTINFFTSLEQENELEKKVNQIITQLNLDGKTDYEKIRAVYDYVTANVKYDYDFAYNNNKYGYAGENMAHSAYSALIDGCAVCQGYANAVYRLLLTAGVDCRIISGDSMGGLHAWNIAKIDDKYYNLDSTWDSENSEYECFLHGSSDFPAHDAQLEFKSEEFKKNFPIAVNNYKIPEAPRTETKYIKGDIDKFDDIQVDPILAKKVRESLVKHNGKFSVDVPLNSKDQLEKQYCLSYANSLITKAAEHDGNPVVGDYIMNQLDNLDFSCTAVSEKDNYSLTIDYSADFYTTSAQEKEVDKKVKQIIADLKLDGKTDYQKVRAVYDYLTKNVKYDKDAKQNKSKFGSDGEKMAQTAYAALCSGYAVSQGYANALYRLMLTAGIDSRIISGKSMSEVRAWNIVKLDDKYYNLDSSLDSENDVYKYFLRGTSDFTTHDAALEFKSYDFTKVYPIAADNYNIPADKTTKTAIIGDVDWDGKLTSADSLKVLRVSVKLETLKDSEFQLADVDESKAITSADSLEILRCSVNLPSSFKKIGTKIEIEE